MVGRALGAGLMGMLLAMPAMADDWEWTLTPYLWGPDTSVDVSVAGDEVLEGDLTFADLVDKLDMAAQLHFEGRRSRLGLLLDATYLDTGDSATAPPRNLLPGGARISTDVKTILFEAGGFYRLTGDTTGLDLLLGVRVIDYDLDVDIALPAPVDLTTTAAASDTLTDGFVGLRYVGHLGERWLLTVRGDVGAGDTDRSVGGGAYLGYRFGAERRFAVLAGYRHLDLEMDDDSELVEVATELTLSGPAVGLLCRF